MKEQHKAFLCMIPLTNAQPLKFRRLKFWFQVNLHLKLGLELELSTWLSSPVFIKGEDKRKGAGAKKEPEVRGRLVVESDGLEVEACDGPGQGGLVIRKMGEVVHRVPGYTRATARVEQLQVAILLLLRRLSYLFSLILLCR